MAGLRRFLLAAIVVVVTVWALLLYMQPARAVSITVFGHPVSLDRRDMARSRARVDVLARELANRQVVLAAPDGRWRFTAGELGLTVMADELFEMILLDLRAGRWAPGALNAPLPVRLDRARLDQALAPLSRAMEIPARDAALRLQGDEPVIEPHAVGRRIDRDQLADGLLDWFSTGDPAEALLVPVVEVWPAETAETVDQMGVRRLIAEATTEYDPTIPRAENVQRAAAAFDGLVLKPGQMLSYTGVVGPIGAETGWKEAFVIVNGELVTGVGGGVCQVATTFYGAVLRAGFEILERHPHQLAVPYVPPGMDAAVAPGFEDLKIRNTTPGHVLIRTEASGGRVTFKLYGDLAPGTEIQVESRLVGRIPFQTVEVADPNLPRGTRVVKSWGADGYMSEAHRMIYQNGTLVRREMLSRDTYRPSRQVEVVGR